MLPRLLFLWLITFFAPPCPAADTQPPWKASLRNGQNPLPKGARVTLELDRPEYFLGENVLLHFTLENTGTTPFRYATGGDYRGSTRALRFDVTATDEAGKIAPDPDTEHQCMGGIMGDRELKPGEKYTRSLALNRYCRFDAPGTYAIRAFHDFGWKETADQKYPAGEIKITFRMPTQAEAEEVIAAMDKMVDGQANGQKSAPYADFSLLHYPVYLPILERRAESNDEQAFQGLASIPGIAATEVLLKLSGNADKKLSVRAARTLNSRLPDPEFTGALPGRGPFRFDRKEDRRRMAAESWDPKFAPAVRAVAVRLLGEKDTESVGTGAFMVQAVGTVAEAPAIVAAIQRNIDAVRGKPRCRAEENVLDLPEPLPELARAMLALGARGYTNDGSGGMGVLFSYFTLLRDQPGPRPPRWQQVFETFAVDGSYPVQEAALRSIPDPMPAECIPTVLKCMNARDLGVVRAACEVAAKSKDTQFQQSALEIVATEEHEWVVRAASQTALASGARLKLYQAWAERLSSERLYNDALQALAAILIVPSSGSGRTDLPRGERLALQTAWRDFLAKHATKIESGQRFALDDPAVTPALAGRAIWWESPKGKRWPVMTEKLEAPPR